MVLAEVEQLDTAVLHELLGRERDDDLAAVRDRHQASRTVDGGAVVVAVADLGWSRVHAHAHDEWPGVAPCLVAEGALRGNRGVDGIVGGAERSMEAVAGGLDDVAVV